jgi:glutathionyl-hydroquinone reductase|tara:strand:- start:1691 stop:1975 length:285 start_codon:yes stop_codon:yes gene_type:complete
MEWLLINKMDEIFFFKDLRDISEFTHLTKSQTNNMFMQSLKHVNRLTNYGYYIQRLYNLPATHQRTKFNMTKLIYFTNHTQENQNYIINKLNII